MRRVIPFLVCFVLSSLAPAFAQQRLFGLGANELIALDTRSATAGHVLHRVPIPSPLRPALDRDDVPSNDWGAVAVNGGAQLAWVSAESGGIVLADTQTGTLRHFAIPGFIAGSIVGTDGNRLVVVSPGSFEPRTLLVADVRTGALRFIDLGRASSLSYAAERHLLFISRNTEPIVSPTFDVDVMDLGTGQIVKTLSVAPANVLLMAVNGAGTRLFLTGAGAALYELDTISGAIVAINSQDSAAVSGALTLDEARNRLLAVGGDGLEAFSIDTLQFLGRTSVPKLRIPNPPGSTFAALSASIDVSPVSATIFAFEGNYEARPFACRQVNLAAVDADTGTVRRFVDLRGQGVRSCFFKLARVTEPLPPTGFSATAAGRRVSLTWAQPTGGTSATRYEVEAGIAPGQTAIVLPTSDTQLVVENVPPGAYHVRVRAINTIGKSSPSQEVRLVVE